MSITSMQKKLLLSLSTLLISGVTVVSFASHASAIDIGAGPIWNNNDAKRLCPGICRSVRLKWNGQWKTVVRGKASVCGCVRR
ncbi:hypothetical protein NIES4071_06950 [Calothrix sp. NIES-4071]|nr:hypothetical protein NIES4071_06950 [Calothrix sp. NIES-4071]BAZ55037.1 hypothetical protein NIES4105_06910 [Calothrix sp. NIES-4105]